MLTGRSRLHGSRFKPPTTTVLVVLLGCVALSCAGDGPVESPPLTLPDLFGSQLFRADGNTVGTYLLESTPVIGIYFASPGCPACGAFTPLLLDAYTQLQEEERAFEVVLVSLGISDSALFDYMVDSSMPWLAVLPQSSEAAALVQRYNVGWVPTLVVIDGAANTISLTGRDELVQEGAAAYEDWLAAGGAQSD